MQVIMMAMTMAMAMAVEVVVVVVVVGVVVVVVVTLLMTEMCRDGIPSHLRGDVWQALLGRWLVTALF